MNFGNGNFGFWGSGSGGGGGGTVTSVGLSMPPSFCVTNSPVTSSGTICVQGAGNASQYIRGDGTLADLPNFAGGAGSQQFYFNGGVSRGVISGQTSYQMSRTANTGASANFAVTGDGFLAQFITDVGSPSQVVIPAGSWFFSAYFSSSNNSGTPQVYATISVWNGTTLTPIATSTNEVITNGTSLDLYNFAAAVPQTTIGINDRIVITFNTVNTGGRTITLYTQSTNLSSVTTTFTNAISSLNGLTANVQFFQTTACGTDFNIVSAGSTHCFNLPTASCINRGALSSSDYATFLNGICCNAFCLNPLGTNNTQPRCGTATYCCILALCSNNMGGFNNFIGNFGAPSQAGAAIWTCGTSLGNNISGGYNNYITGCTCCLFGACYNADVCFNFIGGGCNNQLLGISIGNVIAGGFSNFICEKNCFQPATFRQLSAALCNNFIGGGGFNMIYGNNDWGLGNCFSSIVGGCCNMNGAIFSLIGGGYCNLIFNNCNPSTGYDFVGGGAFNTVGYQPYASIVGGYGNYNASTYGVITGGNTNVNAGTYGFIGSGLCNQFYGSNYGGINNGFCNIINGGDFNSILNGSQNAICNSLSGLILNGCNNTIASGTCFGVVLGGQCNTITGLYSGVANLCGVNATANCTFYFCNICALGCISGGGTMARIVCNNASGCVLAGSASNAEYYYNFIAAGCLILPTAVGNTSIYNVKNVSTTCIVTCFTSGQNADGTSCILFIPNQALQFQPNNVNYNIY
jgi:hypothetical protein